jgi:hypothetical protein
MANFTAPDGSVYQIANLTDAINALNTITTTMQQQQQIPITAQEMRTLLGRVNAPPTFVVPVNQALTPAGGPDVLQEDHPPPRGAKDMKATPPAPFKGDLNDAEPFVHRFEAYCGLMPNQMRLTRTRIITFASFLQSPSSKRWSDLVVEAIVKNDSNSPSYTDNWNHFKQGFLKHFGVQDKEGAEITKLYKLRQGNNAWEAFFLQFDEQCRKAQFDKPSAYLILQLATNVNLRNRVNEYPSPTNYDTFVTKAEEITKSERNKNRINQLERTNLFSHGHNPYSASQASHRREPDVVPMDTSALDHLNAIHQRGKFQGKGKKPQPKGNAKPPPKQGFKTKHPFNSKNRIPTAMPSFGLAHDDQRKKGPCFRCGGPHWIRECTVSDQKLGKERIAALLEFAGRAYEDSIPTGEDSGNYGQEEEDYTQEEQDEEVVEEELNVLGQPDLIDFNGDVEAIEDTPEGF